MLNNLFRKGIEGNKEELADINKEIKQKEAMRGSAYMDGEGQNDGQYE